MNLRHQQREHLVGFGLGHDQRRHQADHAVGRHADQQTCVGAALREHAAGAVELDAQHQALAGRAGVREVRGHGLMLGIELERPCGVLTQRCADAGLLISVTADSVIRLVPPLILTLAEADEIVARLVPLVHAFLTESA